LLDIPVYYDSNYPYPKFKIAVRRRDRLLLRRRTKAEKEADQTEKEGTDQGRSGEDLVG
jgi:hypothetical protein